MVFALFQMSWDGGRKRCKAQGGDLASITNPFEQAFIESALGFQNEPVWIGMNEVSFNVVSWPLIYPGRIIGPLPVQRN